MRRALTLLLFLGITYAAAVIGSVFTLGSVDTWYLALVKPPFNPPSWVFGPVWTILYALMALAAWRVYEKHSTKSSSKKAILLYGTHLIFNALWSIVFFGLHAPLMALVVILTLLLSLGILTVLFWRIDRIAGILFLPYLAWVSFAAYLNLMIVLLN